MMIHEAEEGWVVGKLKSRVVCRLKIDLISGWKEELLFSGTEEGVLCDVYCWGMVNEEVMLIGAHLY